MLVNSDRFGSIEVDANDAIQFPQGIIGFPNDDEFVLLRPGGDTRVAWLQSTKNSALALPVVSLHTTAIDAPLDAITEAARELTIAETVEDCAVMLVVTAIPGIRATVNLLAPILVNATTRVGMQVLLEIDQTALTTPLCLRPIEQDESADSEEANADEVSMNHQNNDTRERHNDRRVHNAAE